MKAFILGQKGSSEQLFTEAGDRIPVTHIKTSPCFLIDIMSNKDTNFLSVKLAHGLGKKTINKPQRGELKKAGIEAPLRFLKEIKLETNGEVILEKDGKKGVTVLENEFYVGSEIKPSQMFKKDDVIAITGVSKGKGFQGVVKRHSFAGGPRTHGQSDRERAPGSIGQTTTPGRVYKGKRMAGRMGGEQITIKGLTVVNSTDDTLTVKGLLPGARNSFLVIKSQ